MTHIWMSRLLARDRYRDRERIIEFYSVQYLFSIVPVQQQQKQHNNNNNNNFVIAISVRR